MRPKQQTLVIRYVLLFLILTVILGTLGARLAAQSAPPSGPLPDLVVTQISVRPETPQVGQPATLIATVANRGTAPVTDSFYVLFQVDDAIAGAPQVSGLAAGTQTDVEVLWIVTAGRHTVTVTADSANRIVESDKTNNQLSRVFEFSGDLTLLDVELNPPHPKPGGATAITATCANTGARDITVRFAVQFIDDRRAFTTRFIDGLAVGQKQTTQADWTPEAGEHVLRVRLDPFKAVNESSTLNNEWTKLIDISTRPPNGADLQVTQLSLDPPNVSIGQTESLKATIVNRGTGPSGPFAVRFQVEGATLTDHSIDSGLAPGAEETIQVSWMPTVGGEAVVRVQADSEGVVVEPDETDGILSQAVQVGPPLNACGQPIFMHLDDADIQILEVLTGFTAEGVRDIFLPGMRQVMETEYRSVNIRFSFSEPARAHSTVDFTREDRQPILGLAPLGARYGTAQVFLGSFTDFPSLLFAPIDRLEIIIGTVASHELGHLLGLDHTSQDDSNDIMSANADLSIFSLTGLPTFTPASLQFLQRELPLTCSR